MGEYGRGYISPQIIRKYAGSPAEDFVFTEVSNTILIDNSIGSPNTDIYFNFDTTATTGSSSGKLQGGAVLELDLRAGSVSIQASTGSVEVQLIRLT